MTIRHRNSAVQEEIDDYVKFNSASTRGSVGTSLLDKGRSQQPVAERVGEEDDADDGPPRSPSSDKQLFNWG